VLSQGGLNVLCVTLQAFDPFTLLFQHGAGALEALNELARQCGRRFNVRTASVALIWRSRRG
jgi:hypothetical protein